MFNYTKVTEFVYEVEADGSIRVPNEHVEKLAEYPALAEEILHFVNDFAVFGTAYRVFLDVVQNFFGVRAGDRTVFPLV